MALRMGRTVGELLESLDAAELVHWFALYEIDPWTDDRLDWNFGQLCSVVANCLTGSKYKPQDFTPEFKPAEQQITADVNEDLLLLQGMKWAAHYGGTIG